MIFDLVRDFADALAAMPAEHPRSRILKLLDETIRRDIHFIHRHRDNYPQAMFQCLWNSCWWYDCPEAALHYQPPEGGWRNPPTWERGAKKLYEYLQDWKKQKEDQLSSFTWVRALRPPASALGCGQVAVLHGHEMGVNSVAYSPDGQRIVSASWDETVRVWDARTGAELAVLRGHEGAVSSVAYSPDGWQIVSGSLDKTVRVWDVQSGCELAVLHGHESWVHSVAYSPDGRRIVSGSDDKTVRVWDAQTGSELTVLRGHEDMIESVAYSPDGGRIVSGSLETARVWDAQTGSELAVLRGHEGWVYSVAYSPDGRHGSSAGRRTRRCGCGTRRRAPSWLSFAATRTWSIAYLTLRTGGGS